MLQAATVQSRSNLLSWALFVILCIIWGSSFILMKAGKEGLNAIQIASFRIFSAGAVFVPFAILFFRKIALRRIPLVILSAVIGNLLPAYLFAAAIEKSVDSALAGILNALTPVCVVVIGALFFQLHTTKKRLAGIFLGFAGIVVLFLLKGVQLANVEHTIWIILGTLLYGLNVNIVTRYFRDLNPLHLTAVSLAFMVIPTGITLLWQDVTHLAWDEPVVAWSVVASVLLGIMGSALATWLFYVLVKLSGGVFASLVTYGIPIIAIAWGVIFGETITIAQIACLLLILSGVHLANKG